MTAPYTVQVRPLQDYELRHVIAAGAERYTKDSEHPIAVDLLVMLASRNERVEVTRRGVRLGDFVSLQPSSVKPFYTLNFGGTTDANGNHWPRSEMITAGLVERLEIEKKPDGIFVINIPE
jgi:hypothetical protein